MPPLSEPTDPRQLVARLDAEIKNNGIKPLNNLIARNPEILEWYRLIVGENPLTVAYRHGSFNVFWRILRKKPQSAALRITPEHTALHVAILYGGPVDLVRKLVEACPWSLEELSLSHQETALLLAFKEKRMDVLKDLLIAMTRLKKEFLLHRRDHPTGNNVLHVAVAENQLGMVKLLANHFSPAVFLELVNSENGAGDTALDIWSENPRGDSDYKAIGKILRRDEQGDEVNSAKMTVALFVAAIAFGLVCELNSILKDEFGPNTVDLLGFKSLPSSFHMISVNTSCFTVSMAYIITTVYSFPSGTTFVLIGIFTLTLYTIIVYGMTPRLLVVVVFGDAPFKIPAYGLIWILAFAYPLIGGTVVFVVRKIIKYSRRTSSSPSSSMPLPSLHSYIHLSRA